MYISRTVNNISGEQIELWDREDRFFYDVLHVPNGDKTAHLKVRSMVGFIPLFAVETLESALVDRLPRVQNIACSGFSKSAPNFLSTWRHIGPVRGGVGAFFLWWASDHLASVIRYMLDEGEFLSPYGIRALSRYHKDHPYVLLNLMGQEHRVGLRPAESSTPNSAGIPTGAAPSGFQSNFLLIESLQKFLYFLGDHYRWNIRMGQDGGPRSGGVKAFSEASRNFLVMPKPRRPVFGGEELFQGSMMAGPSLVL